MVFGMTSRFIQSLMFSAAIVCSVGSVAEAANMNYLGGWANTATYNAGSVVAYNSGIYYSLKSTKAAPNRNYAPNVNPSWWAQVGTVGNTILNGPVNPTSQGLGQVGDFYLNTVTNTLFGPKTAISPFWPANGVVLSGAGGTGVAGPAGATGATGAAGATGPAGATGATGAAGATGSAGATGPVGPAGADGQIGPAGVAGAIGPAGATGAGGADGQIGPAGPQGPQGTQGQKGDSGIDGSFSLLSSEDDNGFVIPFNTLGRTLTLSLPSGRHLINANVQVSIFSGATVLCRLMGPGDPISQSPSYGLVAISQATNNAVMNMPLMAVVNLLSTTEISIACYYVGVGSDSYGQVGRRWMTAVRLD
jgi:hypothetical protein